MFSKYFTNKKKPPPPLLRCRSQLVVQGVLQFHPSEGGGWDTVKLVLRGHCLTQTPNQPGIKFYAWTDFCLFTPHMWTILSCMDSGQTCHVWTLDTKKMYHRTKLPCITWTPSCYFSGWHGNFNELGLR